MPRARKKTGSVKALNNPVEGWIVGPPPEGQMVAMVCRKWFAMHEGQYIEVIAADPKRYLESLLLKIMMQPSVTVIYGKLYMQGEIPFVLDERGSPVAIYPNSVLAWSYVPDPLLNLQAVAMTDMAVRVAKRLPR
jgi:hypothetical protein